MLLVLVLVCAQVYKHMHDLYPPDTIKPSNRRPRRTSKGKAQQKQQRQG